MRAHGAPGGAGRPSPRTSDRARRRLLQGYRKPRRLSGRCSDRRGSSTECPHRCTRASDVGHLLPSPRSPDAAKHPGAERTVRGHPSRTACRRQSSNRPGLPNGSRPRARSPARRAVSAAVGEHEEAGLPARVGRPAARCKAAARWPYRFVAKSALTAFPAAPVNTAGRGYGRPGTSARGAARSRSHPALGLLVLAFARYAVSAAISGAASRWGRRRAMRVHLGIHQAASPSSRISAGTRRARMTVASRMIPAARPIASGLIS
jgi:hypothetical protein